MRLTCYNCRKRIANLNDVWVISDGPRLCHLVARTADVRAEFTYPHRESEMKPYKLGKVRCNGTGCENNLGNIQRFEWMPGQPVFCTLKYANLQVHDPVINLRRKVWAKRLGRCIFGNDVYEQHSHVIRPVMHVHIRALFPQHYDILDSDAEPDEQGVDDLNNQLNALGVNAA